jgi:hypothetical protein
LTALIGNLVAVPWALSASSSSPGFAFILGSVMDTLDGPLSRMSGKGTLFGALLDSTLDRVEEGIVLAAVAGYFAASGDDFAAGDVRGCRARIADGFLHPREGRGAGRRVQKVGWLPGRSG